MSGAQGAGLRRIESHWSISERRKPSWVRRASSREGLVESAARATANWRTYTRAVRLT